AWSDLAISCEAAAPFRPVPSTARVRDYALWTLYSAGLAAGSRGHRTREALGGDARPGCVRRQQRVGLAVGLRPLPHGPDADRGSHARGVVVDVRLRGD